MTDYLIYVPPVLSAILGAIAIRTVGIISTKRSAFSSIYSEIKENQSKIEGTIEVIDQGEWDGDSHVIVKTSAVEAARYRSPNICHDVITTVDGFETYLINMERLQLYQKATKDPTEPYEMDEETMREWAESLRSEVDTIRFRAKMYKHKDLLTRLILLGV
ncbi:hypothetical protein [Haloplanus salinarum]|uniref:hypothetical protein n=1 Tax=Haloplanus salinarum TaxID=1912324 RepID=UPI00214B3749|nr:hypothetical protein [Haloplanus salinarum]